jgi:hypothetical protein
VRLSLAFLPYRLAFLWWQVGLCSIGALLTLSAGDSFAQQIENPTPLRLELAGTRDEQWVDVVPLPADSSLLVYTERIHRHEGDSEKHLFQHYDAALHLQWATTVHLPAGADCEALAADNVSPYALFTVENDDRTLLIVRFELQQHRAQVLHYQLPVAINPLAFEVSGPEAFVVAMAYRQQTVLRLPLTDSAAVQFLPTLSSPTTSIADAAPEPGGLTVVTAERLPDLTRLLVRPFSTGAALPGDLRVLQSPPPASLTSARIGEVRDIDRPRFLAGTYATRDPRFAQGFFSTLLPPPEAPESLAPPTIFYYDLPTLPHYYDRFGPRRRVRAAARARRRRSQGLETIAHARLLLHRPLLLPDGGYILIAEQYYPRYRGDMWGYRNFSQRMYSSLGAFSYGLPGYYGAYDPTNVWDRGLDGYVYTQALVCGFEASGRLRWQQSFVLGNLTRPQLREHVAAALVPGTNEIMLAAPSDNGEHIRYVRVGPTVSSPEKPTELTLLPAQPTRERILETSGLRVLPWYGGRLLGIGFQDLKRPGQHERTAFVIQEVR